MQSHPCKHERPQLNHRKESSFEKFNPLMPTNFTAKGHWIAAHLNTAPVWEPVPQQHLDNILPEYAKLAKDPNSTTWVAVDGEQIVAYVVIYTADTGPEHLAGSTRMRLILQLLPHTHTIAIAGLEKHYSPIS